MSFSPPGFECSKCGECCTGFGHDFGVIVFDFEIGPLAQALLMSPQAVIEAYLVPYGVLEGGLDKTRTVQAYVIRHDGGDCIFLKDKLCSVHCAKPTQCKRGPFGFFWDGKSRYPCMEKDMSNGWSSSQFDIDFVATILFDEEPQMSAAPASQMFSAIKSLLPEVAASSIQTEKAVAEPISHIDVTNSPTCVSSPFAYANPTKSGD